MKLITYTKLGLDNEREEADPFWWDLVYDHLAQSDPTMENFQFDVSGSITAGVEEIVGSQVNTQILELLIGDPYVVD